MMKYQILHYESAAEFNNPHDSSRHALLLRNNWFIQSWKIVGGEILAMFAKDED